MTDDEREIRELTARWMQATRDGDWPAVLDLMDDDVVFLVPGAAPFGKTTFAATADAMTGVLIDGESEVQEVRVLGDWAFMLTRLRVEATPPGGATMRRSGHTLTILRKGADGRWRIARDANLLTPEGG